jgi:hypothetical protein
MRSSALAAALFLFAFVAPACQCGERIVPLGDDDAGTDAGTPDASIDAGPADSGVPDAGARDREAHDGGTADAGATFELERALRECERIESCMLGPSDYDGLTFLNACITFMGEPVPDPAHHAATVANRLRLYTSPTRDLNYLVWLDEPAVQTCIRAQATCEGLFACFNRGAEATRCNPQAPAVCQGNVLVTCQAPSYTYKATYGLDGGFSTFSYDCGIGQRICSGTVGSQPSFGCAPATCAPGSQRCDGDVARRCYDGLVDDVTCGDGYACVARAPSDVVCGGSGGSCNVPASRSHCDGAQQLSCVFGAWAATDCAPGLSCHTAPDGVGFCGAAGECDPWEDVATCDPVTGQLSVCAMGKKLSVDCLALGFQGCMAPDVNHPALCR